MPKKIIEKRFPASTTLESKTFLNDKKIDGELYALLQTYSKGINSETVICKKDLPSQAAMCKTLGYKSPKTFRAHLAYLIQQGYIEEHEDEPEYYYVPRKEDSFFQFPLTTVQFLLDTATENVIKVYIYLGQRFNWKAKTNETFIFTLEDIAEHIGLPLNNHQRNYIMLTNILDCLDNNGLIRYVSFYEGKVPKKRLVGFSMEHRKSDAQVNLDIQ